MNNTPVIKIHPDVEYMAPESYEPPELKIVIQEPESQKYCPHEQIKVYPHHRLVQCSNCGITLDAFDYLVAVGKQEGNQLSNIRFLKAQSKQLGEDLELLRKEISKARKELNGSKTTKDNRT